MTSYDGIKIKASGPSRSLVLVVAPAVVGLAVLLAMVLLGVVLLVGAVVTARLGFKRNGGSGEFRHLHYTLS
jgi:hypothetical protein